MANLTYKPTDFSLICGGFIITGFQPETMLEIAFEGEFYTMSTDTSGRVVRYKQAPPFANVKVYLTQASLDNDTLSSFMVADIATDAGAFPMHIVDGSGTTTFTALKCWVQSPVGSLSFGNDDKGREWTIRATEITHFVGGIS